MVKVKALASAMGRAMHGRVMHALSIAMSLLRSFFTSIVTQAYKSDIKRNG